MRVRPSLSWVRKLFRSPPSSRPRVRLGAEGLEDRAVPTTLFVTAPTPGTNSPVYTFTRAALPAGDAGPSGQVAPLGTGLTSGLTTASGDLDGDGRQELIVAGLDPNNLTAGQSRVFIYRVADNGALTLADNFLPFAGQVPSAGFIAAGDVDRDGTDELIVGSILGDPRVRIIKDVDRDLNFGEEVAANNFTQFNPFVGVTFADPNIRPVRVGAGDFDGDGRDEVVVGSAATGTAPIVRTFSFTGLTAAAGGLTATQRASFEADFNNSYQGGAFVAAGDVNRDGRDDLVLGQGNFVFERGAANPDPGGQRRVFVYASPVGGFTGSAEPAATPLASFTNQVTFDGGRGAGIGGIFVSAGDADNDGDADIFTGENRNGDRRARLFINGDATTGTGAAFTLPADGSSPVYGFGQVAGEFPRGNFTTILQTRVRHREAAVIPDQGLLPDATGGGIDIPDNSAAGASTTITIDALEAGPIKDVNVLVGFTHTLPDTDIERVELTQFAPDGVTQLGQVILANAAAFNTAVPAGNGSGVFVEFDQEASAAVNTTTAFDPTSRQVVGVFRPINNVDAAFLNRSSAGVWRLRVVDNVAADRGRIVAFQLAFEYTSPTAVVPSLTPLLQPVRTVTVGNGNPVAGSFVPLPGPARPAFPTPTGALPAGGIRIPQEGTGNGAAGGQPENDFGNTSLLVRPELAGAIATGQLTFNLTHTARADLDVFLVRTAPNGTRTSLQLFNNNLPANPVVVNLAAPFVGLNSEGVWTLVVRDDVGADIGTVDSFQIRFTYT